MSERVRETQREERDRERRDRKRESEKDKERGNDIIISSSQFHHLYYQIVPYSLHKTINFIYILMVELGLCVSLCVCMCVCVCVCVSTHRVI